MSGKNWFNDARFGLFLHWGAYSVAGRGEWVLNREHIPYPEYTEKYVNKFRAENYKPSDWAQVALDAGMKYVVLTTKHHDGFCLWDTATTDFNSVKLGPQKDLVRPYVKAMRNAGLKVGLYHSVADWHHPDYPGAYLRDWPTGWPSEEQRQRFVDFYQEQVRELLTNYGRIDLLWWDGVIPWPMDGENINTEAKRLQPEILINPSNGEPCDFGRCEQAIVPDPDRDWEACLTLWNKGTGWCYTPEGHDYCTPRQVIHNLITCASSGGNLLLNVGPAPDGTIPQKEVEILKQVGCWLKENGDSIYGASRSPFSWNCMGKLTTKGNSVYFHIFQQISEDTICLAEIANKVLFVKQLHNNQDLEFEQTGTRLVFRNPKESFKNDLPVTVVIQVEGAPTPIKEQENFWIV